MYNGKKSPYPDNLDLIKLFNNQKLAKNTFGKPARLIDLTTMSDQTIKKHNIISLLEFVQKHVRDQKLLKNTIRTLANIIDKLDRCFNISGSIEVGGWLKDYINGNLHYIYYFANIINNEEFTKELEKVDFIKRENSMNAFARKIEQKGIEQGIEKTALAMLTEGLDLNLISKITKLTIEDLNKLNAENTN